MKKYITKTFDTDSEIHPEAGIRSGCSIEKIRGKRKSPLLAALLSLIIPDSARSMQVIYLEDLHYLRGWD
jgi:hypothetical protein